MYYVRLSLRFLWIPAAFSGQLNEGNISLSSSTLVKFFLCWSVLRNATDIFLQLDFSLHTYTKYNTIYFLLHLQFQKKSHNFVR